jgi:hypothetical protein
VVARVGQPPLWFYSAGYFAKQINQLGNSERGISKRLSLMEPINQYLTARGNKQKVISAVARVDQPPLWFHSVGYFAKQINQLGDSER